MVPIMIPIMFMFSGQGSHYYQMGRDLFEQNNLFKQKMLQADVICQDLIGTSIITKLYSDPKSKPFTKTLFTHPAIFMLQYALGEVLLAEDIIPSAVLGTSLGEFTASVFAGVISFEAALTMVITQAQMIEQHCKQGSMLAVLSLYQDYYTNPIIYQNSELASINFASHFVISGNTANLTLIEESIKTQHTVQFLATNHAFHSSMLDQAAPFYLGYIYKQTLKKPNLAFRSCSASDFLTNILPRYYWDIIRLPIQFQNNIRALELQQSYYYLDVGPSGTLANFVKYNLAANSASKAFATLTPFGLENLQNLKHKLRT